MNNAAGGRKENNKIVLNEEDLVIGSDGTEDKADEKSDLKDSTAKNDKKVSMPIEIGDKTKRCFAAGGTSGYLVLTDEDRNYYFQYIDSVAETIETFETKVCDGKSILNMAVDKDNNLSLFLLDGISEGNTEGARIVKIDKNGIPSVPE